MFNYDDPTLKEIMSSPSVAEVNEAMEDLDDWFNGIDSDEDLYF